jgi:hypothetical protein
MSEIQPIIQWVQANLPWADEALMFIGFARLLAKPISAWLQGLFSKLLAFVERTPETDDDEWLRRVLASVPYRVLSFVVDLLLSVKLPTSETVTKAATARPIPVPLVLLVGLLGLGLVGCGTPGQRPPSATEQKYFEVVTNLVPVVLYVTNTTETTETTAGTLAVTPVTNYVEQYDFTPNQNAQATVATGAAVGSIWGAGTTVGAALLGLFTTWGVWRSRKQPVATAEELAQIIETGRQVLLSLPDGAKYEAAWKNWMVKHQAHTGVISQVSQLVATAVDKDKAKGAAQAIVNLIAAAQATAAK